MRPLTAAALGSFGFFWVAPATVAGLVPWALTRWRTEPQYAAAVALAVFAFVVFYEEPALARQFGEGYARYRAHVPRWWPRLRPWPGEEPRGLAAASRTTSSRSEP